MPLPTAVAEHMAHSAISTSVGGGTSSSSPIGRSFEYGWNEIKRNLIPDATQILELYRRGYCDLQGAQSLLAKHGIAFMPEGAGPLGDWTADETTLARWWGKVYKGIRPLPTFDQFLVLWNRLAVDEAAMDGYRIRLGFEKSQEWERWQKLRFDIPGPSDLVRFSVRHVFEPDLIGRFRFNDEFNPILDIWHHGHGQQYPIFTGPFKDLVDTVGQEFGTGSDELARRYTAEGLPEPTWARAYWWSHWVWPSPTQSYMFLQQLRPGRHRERFPNEQEHPEFTVQDLNYLLRGNDYPPAFRPLLRAVSYRVPGFRQVRQLREQEVIAEDEHRKMYEDMGYSPRDARMLEQGDFAKIKATKRGRVEQQARGQFERAWNIGAIDDGEYYDLLTRHGLTQQDAQDTLQLARTTRRLKKYEAVVRFTHRQFVRGQITESDVRRQLNDLGMEQEPLGDMIDVWRIELNGDVRLVNAERAVKWACDGLITTQALVDRLRNLHYLDDDIRAWVAQAAECVAARVAKAAQEARRAQRQRVRDLRREITEARSDIRWNQTNLARHGTQEQLANWYWQGLIPLGIVADRLRFLGWPQDDIERHLAATKPGKAPHGQPRRD